jgi:hypothetical protein
MAEMALAAFLFSACVNFTRDGKNPEDELAGKNDQQWSECLEWLECSEREW